MLKKLITFAVLFLAALFLFGLVSGGPANAARWITGHDIKDGSIMYKDLNRTDVRLKIDENTRRGQNLEGWNSSQQEQIDRLSKELEDLKAQN